MAALVLSLSLSSPYSALFPSRNPSNSSVRLLRFRTIAQSPPLSRSADQKITPFPALNRRIMELNSSLYGTMVAVGTTLLAPDHPDIHHSQYTGPGVCFDPELVLTSAHVVGRVAGNKAYIGSLSGRTAAGDLPVQLIPLAVSFAVDVAVLKIERPRLDAVLDVCKVAESPTEKNTVLFAITLGQGLGLGLWMGSVAAVRAVGERKTVPAKAPWPLKDEVGWIEHDWLAFNRGPPPPDSVLFNRKEKVTGSVGKLSGSPWFNLYGELVGVASWVLRDDPAGFSVGYAAPMTNIWPVVHYAKTKMPHDPVVMDDGIDRRGDCRR